MSLFFPNMTDLFDFRDLIGPKNPTSIRSEIEDESKRVVTNVKTLVIITIITIGFLGNIINMCVFGKKKMRNVSTFRFLFYLSAADFMVLTFGATHVLIKNIFQVDIRVFSNFVCKFHTFFTYVRLFKSFQITNFQFQFFT